MSKKLTNFEQYPKNIPFESARELAKKRKKRRDDMTKRATENTQQFLKQIRRNIDDKDAY